METITLYPKDALQSKVVKSYIKDLKIRFEIKKEKPYNEDFVQKILEAEVEIKQGKSISVTSKEFDELWK
jgi:hypothetical protein